MQERDTGHSATVVQPELGVERRRPLGGVGVWRVLLVLLYLAVTWPLVLGTSTTPFPANVPEGVVVAALLLVVLAAINFGWHRWRWSRADREGYRPRYRVSITAIPVVLVALVLAGLDAAGTHLNAAKARQTLATGDATSRNPVDRDRGAYAAWLSAYPTAIQEMAAAVHDLRLARQEEAKAHPSLTRLRADLSDARSHAKRYLAAVSTLAANRPVVQRMKTLHLREARTLVAATSDYVRGFAPYNQHLLDAGDTLWTNFVAQVRASGQAEDATYHRLGGYGAFKSRVDWDTLANEISAVRSTASSG